MKPPEPIGTEPFERSVSLAVIAGPEEGRANGPAARGCWRAGYSFFASRTIEVYLRTPSLFLLSNRLDRRMVPSCGSHSLQ